MQKQADKISRKLFAPQTRLSGPGLERSGCFIYYQVWHWRLYRLHTDITYRFCAVLRRVIIFLTELTIRINGTTLCLLSLGTDSLKQIHLTLAFKCLILKLHHPSPLHALFTFSQQIHISYPNNIYYLFFITTTQWVLCEVRSEFSLNLDEPDPEHVTRNLYLFSSNLLHTSLYHKVKQV